MNKNDAGRVRMLTKTGILFSQDFIKGNAFNPPFDACTGCISNFRFLVPTRREPLSFYSAIQYIICKYERLKQRKFERLLLYKRSGGIAAKISQERTKKTGLKATSF